MQNKFALSLHIHAKDLHPLRYFPATLKLLSMCMKPDFLSTRLKEPDGFSDT